MKIFFSQGAYVNRKEIRYTKKVENKIYYMTNCVIQTKIEVYASRDKIYWMVFRRVAITKYHRLRGLSD